MNKLWVIVLLVGCSGGGSKYRIEDSTIASISMEEKRPVLDAQNEVGQAKAEQQKAEADYKNADHELDIAENEYKTAKLQLDTAKINQKAAEQSGDINRKNSATRDLHVVELGVKTADAKVDWLAKKRKWMKAWANACEEHVRAAGARTELEKAKLVQQKGIRPSEDFNVMNFESENLKWQQKYTDARANADRLHADVDGLERTYTTKKMAFEQAQGASRPPQPAPTSPPPPGAPPPGSPPN